VTKQSDAKARQQYVDKVAPRVCGNCAHFTSEQVCTNAEFVNEWNKPYFQEKNMRCALGEFKVKKLGTCIEHKSAESK
jgi:hypothetical protein